VLKTIVINVSIEKAYTRMTITLLSKGEISQM